jgi:hypothetical protein
LEFDAKFSIYFVDAVDASAKHDLPFFESESLL